MQKSLNVKPAMTGTLFKIILNYNIKYYYIINLANFTALNYFDMAYADCIEQQGTVEGISGNKVLVRIRQISGCGQCHAKGMCSVTEMKDKIIEAYHSSPDLSEGDTVFVGMKRSMGNKAVILGYMIPFILMISVLLALDSPEIKEWVTGVAAMVILVPYYLTLYLFRNRLRKTFTFILSKHN